MVIAVLHQLSVEFIWKQHCCYGDYCPLSTKRGVYENNTAMVITVRYQQNVDSIYENNTVVMVHTVY